MREGMGSFGVLATNIPDKLIAGQSIAILESGILLKAGQGVLLRGSVIGIETATGKGILCDANAVDGSEVAKVILAEDSIDTTESDLLATCYKTGMFNKKALIFGANGEPETVEADLRRVNIHLLDEIAY